MVIGDYYANVPVISRCMAYAVCGKMGAEHVGIGACSRPV